MGPCGTHSPLGGWSTGEQRVRPGYGGCGPQRGVCASYPGPWGAMGATDNALTPEGRFLGSPVVAIISWEDVGHVGSTDVMSPE